VPEVLEFCLDGSRYGVRLDRVVEVAPRVRVTPLPGTPGHVVGAFVYRGEVALAVDVRARLGHEPKRPSLDDHFLVTRGRLRPIAAVVDRVVGIASFDAEAVRPAPGRSGDLAGVVTLPDGLMLLDDLETVLSAEDEELAENALRENETTP
jgi:purine-binding chemotaxis protein CheW